MRKIGLALIFCSLLLSCKTATTPDPEPGNFGNNFRVSPDNFFRIFPHTYGMVTDNHLVESEMFWEGVSQCMSIDPSVLNNYRILLEDSMNFKCGNSKSAGCYYNANNNPAANSYIAILGSPDLIFPDKPDYGFDRRLEYKRIWRHELVHLGFAIRNEDWHHDNGSNLWDCQCPPDYPECLNRELNIQRLETIRVH